MDYSELTVKSLLEKFSDSNPTPGGGSAAALSGALAASLVAMVARITFSNKKYEDRAEEMRNIAAKADELRVRLLELVQEDAKSYDAVSSAFKLPKDTDEEKAARRQAIQDALKMAAFAPTMTLDSLKTLLPLALDVVEKGNPNCITDAVASTRLIEAAMETAIMNIHINLDSIKDEEFKSKSYSHTSAAMEEARPVFARAREAYLKTRE
ncbi:MAG: cyclodeaminase/cyclohydrolase family protein [Planctomycetota bacterium]